MKKLYSIFIPSLLFANCVFGQITMYDLIQGDMKYWKLRGRLTGDENNRNVYNGFMVIGDDKGESLIADTRYPLLV